MNVYMVLALFFMFVPACSRPVATVNGKAVDKKIYEALVKEKLDAAGVLKASPEGRKVRESVAQELIAEAIIMEEAQKKGIKVSDDEVNRIIDDTQKGMGEEAFAKKLREKGLSPEIYRKRTREKLVMSKFTEGLIGGESVSDDEMRRYYAESPIPFYKSSKVLMNMVEFSSEKEAAAVMDEIRRNNLDFDETAQRLAAEKKATVSDYGWVNPEFFSAALAHAVRSMKPGSYGGPFKGRKDFYLVKVKDKEKQEKASFDEVKDSIRNTLLDRKRQESFARWIDERKKASKIVINVN